VDPDRAQGPVVRLPRQVRRGGHAVPVPRPGRRRRGRDPAHRAGGVPGRRLPRLGPRRRHARSRERTLLSAGSEYRAGHDQPLGGAGGGAPGRPGFRRTVLAHPGTDAAGGGRLMTAVLRILAWLLAVALVALPVVAVVNGWIGADRWPLTRLRVHGEFERVD